MIEWPSKAIDWVYFLMMASIAIPMAIMGAFTVFVFINKVFQRIASDDGSKQKNIKDS